MTRSPIARNRAQTVIICDNHKFCRNYSIACRVHPGDDAIRGTPPGRIRLLLTSLKLLRRKSQWTAPVDVDTYYERLVKVVDEMRHIQELELRLTFMSTQDSQYSHKLRFTKHFLSVTTSGITRLRLNCALEDLHMALSPDTHLPRLCTLKLSLRTDYDSSDPTEPLPLLRSFLMNHADTIEDMDLSFSYRINPSTLLIDLPVFPRLSDLLLSYHIISLDPSFLAGLKQFMSLNHNHLRGLYLVIRSHPFIHSVPHNAVFASGTTATLIPIHDLKELSIRMTSRSILAMNVKPHLQQYQSTLTSLQLNTNIWSLTEIRHAFSGVMLNLGRFSLTVAYLSPTLLAYLALTFPTLQYLVVDVTFRVASEPDVPFPYHNPQQLPPFARDLSGVRNVLLDWALGSINVLAHQTAIEDRVLLVQSLPQVRTFCEMDPDEYSQSIDDPGPALRKRGGYWGEDYQFDC
ncbi:hypothetical protein CVT24_008482 [Panaeolus cyanescens]|uniref:F-box domain-containing protein n=1 Tax=Panaeolus cyanescens TaxID=181874 RepID=A0A409VBU3_9AGAR|nr:hypothetical protein CVT24_008482 [Panaeolus cyanescens]